MVTNPWWPLKKNSYTCVFLTVEINPFLKILVDYKNTRCEDECHMSCIDIFLHLHFSYLRMLSYIFYIFPLVSKNSPCPFRIFHTQIKVFQFINKEYWRQFLYIYNFCVVYQWVAIQRYAGWFHCLSIHK